MNFLVDAQLPKRLVLHLELLGFNAKHTLDLPNKNRTTDQEITEIADAENRVLITKDRDFWDSFILTGKPQKLLLVSTGNIGNNELIDLFSRNIHIIDDLFQTNAVIEINSTEMITHF